MHPKDKKKRKQSIKTKSSENEQFLGTRLLSLIESVLATQLHWSSSCMKKKWWISSDTPSYKILSEKRVVSSWLETRLFPIALLDFDFCLCDFTSSLHPPSNPVCIICTSVDCLED
ncbi:hypothetical protein CEXT_55241 [Caerostris extrusa]|uniref:Uncharacterized protein n=1 Tax=Caerostris extrusa TaxID=172846 RepID=A0AAV4QDZ5_CAEEX|nr:hypothetical protein CEXT_55241 [Caerostris extrusa]